MFIAKQATNPNKLLLRSGIREPVFPCRSDGAWVVCSAKSIDMSRLTALRLNRRTRFKFTLMQIAAIVSHLSTDARIPTPSAPSIEANGSDLIAINVVLLDVGRRCAFREGNSG
jgi:hypothetical protein